MDVKQCAVLFINPGRKACTHPFELQQTGFVVREIDAWPEDDALLAAEIVVVRVTIDQACMVAARLRARPKFGRRVLVAFVCGVVAARERRAAIAGGFDDLVTDACDAREFADRVMRILRSRPEHPCGIPSGDTKSAA